MNNHSLRAEILKELSTLDEQYLRSKEGMELIHQKKNYIRQECCSECAHAFANEVMTLMYKSFLEEKK